MPGLTDVRSAFTDEALATLQIDPALPIVALRIPNVGELSRKEREDNHPLFDQKKGAKFIDDFKRLAKSFPESAAKVRELAGAADEDFVIVVAGDPAHHIKASDTKFPGRLSEREINVYAAAGNFRAELAKKYADKHGAFQITDEVVQKAAARGASQELIDGSDAFHPMWLTDFPMFEYDLAAGKWVPAHHPFTAPYRSRHEKPRERSGQRARQLLRPGDERSRARVGLHPNSPQGRAAGRSSGRWASAKRKRGRALASSSTRSNTARRRMAALRWGSTAL